MNRKPAQARYARLCGRSTARAFPVTRSCKSRGNLHDYGKQASILAGATLHVSPARLTRGSAPSTPDRSALPKGFADCRMSPGCGRRTRLGRRYRRGSAVPMGCPGSESEVAAPVNPPRAWRRAWPSRKGSLVREQPRRRWRGCENTLAATPHRAFGEGGCSRHGPSRWCATGDPTAQPQDVDGPEDKQEARCESPDGQTVNRPPASFSHRSAAQHAARIILQWDPARRRAVALAYEPVAERGGTPQRRPAAQRRRRADSRCPTEARSDR